MQFDIKIINEKTINVEIIKINPKINICKAKLISDEKMKFGKKTLKNKNTLGFKTFIKKPVLKKFIF